jgi:hypothetical protein
MEKSVKLRQLAKVCADPCPSDPPCPTLLETDHDTYLVQGWIVTDPEALSQLNIPETETVVEVPKSLFDVLRNPETQKDEVKI